MSPIPERSSVSPEMFSGLEGIEFFRVSESIEYLCHNIRSTTLQPPDSEILLHNHQFHDITRKSIRMKISEAILFRGSHLVPNLKLFMSPSLIPDSPYALNKDTQLHKLFGISTGFKEKHQIISVKRKNLPEITFQHDGLQRPVKEMHRCAILALAIVPDELWKKIHSRGFVFASLEGDFYDKPWQVINLGNGLPDPNQAVKYGINSKGKVIPGFLETFSINHQNEVKNIEFAQKIYPSLDPVGIFIDRRTITEK